MFILLICIFRNKRKVQNLLPCKTPNRGPHITGALTALTAGHSVTYEDPDAHLGHHRPLVMRHHHNIEVSFSSKLTMRRHPNVKINVKYIRLSVTHGIVVSLDTSCNFCLLTMKDKTALEVYNFSLFRPYIHCSPQRSASIILCWHLYFRQSFFVCHILAERRHTAIFTVLGVGFPSLNSVRRVLFSVHVYLPGTHSQMWCHDPFYEPLRRLLYTRVKFANKTKDSIRFLSSIHHNCSL